MTKATTDAEALAVAGFKKTCSSCGQTKWAVRGGGDFNKYASPDGFYKACKACLNATRGTRARQRESADAATPTSLPDKCPTFLAPPPDWDWGPQASCATYPGDLWFSDDLDDQDKAILICATCPVKAECEANALHITRQLYMAGDIDTDVGIQAGLKPYQRMDRLRATLPKGHRVRSNKRKVLA